MTALPRPVVLAHGYTLDDLHQLARLAVHTAGRMGMDWHERYDLAYSTIAEHLYAAGQPPERHDLVAAGRRGIFDVVTGHQRHHGYYKAKTCGTAHGAGSSPAFARFWYVSEAPFEQPLVERLTVQAILPTLTARQRAVFAALAATDDHLVAAQALGIELSSYKSLIGRARRAFYALWHEGETPSRPYRLDKRVGRRSAEVPA